MLQWIVDLVCEMILIRAVIDSHKKRFKRHPIVITIMVLWGIFYMVDRCQNVYFINHDIEGFLIESLIYYFAAFYFVPAFFDRNDHEKKGDEFLEKMRKQNSSSERIESMSSHRDSSLSASYDHNRNSPSSSRHNSSLGRGFL